MGALLIVNYNVTNRELLDEYRSVAGPILIGEGNATRVALSDQTVDLSEGTAAGSDTVVLRFPSVEAAQAVWQSDEYQAIIKKRLDATAPKIALIVPTVD